MNVIDIALFVVVLLIILIGYFRGFLVSILSLARYLLGIPFCYFIAKSCSEPLYNSLLRENIGAQISQAVESTGLDSILAGVIETVNGFPEELQNAIDLSFLNNINAANASQGIMQNVVDPVAVFFLRIILFIAILVVFLIVSAIVLSIVKKATKKDDTPIKKTNKYLGAAFGAVKAVLILIVLATAGNLAVTYLAGAGSFIDEIGSSAVIGFINKFNPLLNAIGDLQWMV